MTTTAALGQGPIAISVAPAQAAYFAGEPFSFTITFRNTNDPAEYAMPNSGSHAGQHTNGAGSSSPRAAAFEKGHKSSHSISSAPLARPPTSPGTPKLLPSNGTSSPPPASKGDPLRKGLVGHRHEGPRSPAGATKQRGLSKSLSVNVSTPQEILNRLAGDGKGSPITQRAGLQSPSSPRVSSPLRREPILPSSHPHARKHSLQEISLPSSSYAASAPTSAPPVSTHPRPPLTVTSTSAFPALDPIREFLRSPLSPIPVRSPPLPQLQTQPIQSNGATTDTPHTNGDAYFKRQQPPPTPTLSEAPSPSTSQPELLPPFKFGRAASSPSVATPRPTTRQRSSSTVQQLALAPPGSELLLWSYAQLSGTLELDDALIRPETQAALRQQLRAARVVGGGRMHLEDGLMPKAPTRSIGGGFFSSLFGGGQPAQAQTVQVDDGQPMPTLETRQTMLVVDLSLTPGEQKSFKYTTTLPAVLPPTFRGRAIRLSYTLVLGACRAEGGSARRQYSRVMKIPIRLYNHVTVGRAPSPYDLLWPIARRRERPAECVVDEVADQIVPAKPSKTTRPWSSSSAAALEEFGRRLLAVRDRGNLDTVELPTTVRSPMPQETSPAATGTGAGANVGCKEAVEIATRNPKKLSFDVNKDGRKVAVLTFVKSAYRLGETILGVVEFNSEQSGPRVLELSAMLEAQEEVPASWLVPESQQPLRRVHAEHHEALVVGSSRTSFALNIPSDASPDFSLESATEGDVGGVVWKVRLCLLVAVPPKPKAKTTPDPSLLGPPVDQEPESSHLVLDEDRSSAWAASWLARGGIAPLSSYVSSTRGFSSALLSPGGAPMSASLRSPMTPSTWTAMLTSPFTATGATPRDWGVGVVNTLASQRGMGNEWRMETVECEVPVRVWPGNTAFRPADVIFDV
ncbi:Rgp1-domain-containing protein [Auriculariales sp. MPI-PUGE-AT-0066]|nr:Rgp1-domain-containing protein [Auriculariales sp. MPI-PUGE-AT-0066]